MGIALLIVLIGQAVPDEFSLKPVGTVGRPVVKSNDFERGSVSILRQSITVGDTAFLWVASEARVARISCYNAAIVRVKESGDRISVTGVAAGTETIVIDATMYGAAKVVRVEVTVVDNSGDGC